MGPCAALVLLLSALLVLSSSAGEVAMQHAGVNYRTVSCKPRQIRVLWKDDKGGRLGGFLRAATYLREKGQPPLMLMNGGIFEPGFVPSGLCIQNGRQLTPVNLQPGRGNFFFRPNGILAISGHSAVIRESSAFAAAKTTADQAIQSGPMLVLDGKIHPAFTADSPSRLHRNGAGILPDGSVLFAITNSAAGARVNLHGFASFFLSRGCRDALFLDGDISQMWTTGQAAKATNPFASILAVVE
jgi:uncharacterized protein YigE (DUF2233 family)